MLRAAHGGCGSCLSFQGTATPSPRSQQQAPRLRKAIRFTNTIVASLKSPKGFGPPPPTPNKSSKPSPADPKNINLANERASDTSDSYKEEDDEVPEIVMDRMIKRIGVSVAIPIALAVIVFPSFWYLKSQLRWDVPEWLPLLVSGLLFSSAAFGISYGILSTSWDPLRDGSFLGWKEATLNWPIFFDNLQGSKSKK